MRNEQNTTKRTVHGLCLEGIRQIFYDRKSHSFGENTIISGSTYQKTIVGVSRILTTIIQFDAVYKKDKMVVATLALIAPERFYGLKLERV